MTIYIVRQQSTSDNPADHGQELARFKTWTEASVYADKMWTEDSIRAYVSEETDSATALPAWVDNRDSIEGWL